MRAAMRQLAWREPAVCPQHATGCTVNCAAQHSTAQVSTAPHCTAQRSTAMHRQTHPSAPPRTCVQQPGCSKHREGRPGVLLA